MKTSPDTPPADLLEVGVLAPAAGTFTYRVPASLAPRTRPGARLLVPFGRRRLTGIALSAQTAAAPGAPAPQDLREILDVLDDETPALPPRLLELLRWVSAYYLHPIGLTLRAALPAAMIAASRRTVAITREGREALRAGLCPAGEALEALRYLARRGRVPDRALAERHPGSALETLAKKGWATREEILSRVSAPTRVRWRVCVGGEDLRNAVTALARRAPRQSAALAELAERGPLLAQDIPAGAGWNVAALRALERRGLAAREREPADLDPFLGVAVTPDTPPSLTGAQTRAVEAIGTAVTKGDFETFLLFGATGSGKTEVYLRVIGEALAGGAGALVLVPEIALTPQLVHRFRARFGDRVAVQHSGLTDRERADQWRRIRKGDLPIVIGARSAVFAPLPRVGAVIVDEEHEGTYKQEENLLYHARDVAVMRAKRESAVAVLGSATPSLESFNNAAQGRYRRLDLPGRVAARPFPKVDLIDMRREPPAPGGGPPALSGALRKALSDTLARGEQAILFLNRRGFAPFVHCRDCGEVFRCPNCDLSLVLHRTGPPAARGLRCHTCEYRAPAPARCPRCGGAQAETRGLGTERVEAEVRAAVSGARTVRLDRDATERRGAQEEILGRLREGHADVLVGTQMVAKGHDFPGVTLVGVISAEASLHFPDFRAPERSFQLLTQVAGRAGRGEVPGRVLVQTIDPDHPCLAHVRAHDYAAFYEEEIAHRRVPRWPPVCRLVNFRVTGPTAQVAEEAALRCAAAARDILQRDPAGGAGVEVLGPAPAVVARVQNRWRWQVLLRGDRVAALRRVATGVLGSVGQRVGPGGAVLVVDVDPVGML
jgi:primosomal protein N' (replication factor Y)